MIFSKWFNHIVCSQAISQTFYRTYKTAQEILNWYWVPYRSSMDMIWYHTIPYWTQEIKKIPSFYMKILFSLNRTQTGSELSQIRPNPGWTGQNIPIPYRTIPYRSDTWYFKRSDIPNRFSWLNYTSSWPVRYGMSRTRRFETVSKNLEQLHPVLY